MKKEITTPVNGSAQNSELSPVAASQLDPALKKLIFILLLGGMAPLVDTTIVNVAINTLQKELQAPVSVIQWVNTAYLLALAMAIPVTGWAVKRFGGKTMWLFSLSLFLIGSILCGLAWNATSLIIWRVVQGVGAGLMQPVMMTLLTTAAGKTRLGRAITLATLFAVIVPIFGPAVGGLIVKNMNWNWIFFVNIPICSLALFLAWKGIVKDKPQGNIRLDILGLILLSPSMALIIYSLSQATLHKSFTDPPIITLFIAGLLLLCGFIANALRNKSEPVINLRLFKSRQFSVAAILFSLSGLSFFGASFLIPLYFQRIYKTDALMAGLFLSLQGIGSLLSRWVGKYIDKTGPKPIILIGMVAATAGTFIFTQSNLNTNIILLDISLVVRGFGLSAANIAIMAAAYQDLPQELLPDASSATRIMQQIGGSFGVAIIAIILQRKTLESQVGQNQQVHAFNNAFSWTLGFTLVAFLLAWVLPNTQRAKTGNPR